MHSTTWPTGPWRHAGEPDCRGLPPASPASHLLASRLSPVNPPSWKQKGQMGEELELEEEERGRRERILRRDFWTLG